MSAIHIIQIATRLRESFAHLIDKADLSENDLELDKKVISRCLAAYGVMMRSGCTALEAAASITDGAEDHGLDAVFYSEISKRLFLVQSKWIQSGRGEPDSGEVSKFRDGVRDLVNLEKDRFNYKIQNSWDVIVDAISSYGIRYEIILIHTGGDQLAPHSTRILEDLINELNDPEPVVKYQCIGQSRIYSSLASGVSGNPIDLEITLSKWGSTEAPHKAYYGSINGEDVAQWWKTHGDSLFEDNLRKMLGQTDVNREIRATIEDRPEDFWYFNNGITLVAKEVSKSMSGGATRDFGSFKAHDVSIVNGAQTVSSIGKFDGPKENLQKVQVPVRIISLENAENKFGAEVTRTNNRQNRIEARDFVAQDREQLRLRTELSMSGFDYNLARSESFTAGPKAFDLTEATAALACDHSDPSFAVQAKREIGRFWLDTSSSLYRTLFNPSIDGLKVYRAVVALRAIEAAIEQETQNLRKRSGRDYNVLIHGNRSIAALVFETLRKSQRKDEWNHESTEFKDRVTSITKRVTQILTNGVETHFPGGFLATVFKNAAKSKILHYDCINVLNTTPTSAPTQALLDLGK